MKRKNWFWYIKERTNPQLGVYYVALGQISATLAKQNEKSSYGRNRVIKFETESEYLDNVKKLNARQ